MKWVVPGSRVLWLASVWLLGVSPLCSAEAANVITTELPQPGPRSRHWYGFEVGPAFSLPLPAASANRDVIGLDGGVSITAKLDPNVGFGANVAYHYWPVSAEWKDAFNRFLRSGTLGTLELGEGTWGLEAIQVGGHVHIAPFTDRGLRPWLQLGAGVYHLDPNTTGYSGDAGFFQVIASPLKRSSHLGGSIAFGADLFGGRFARMGVDATYHVVGCRNYYNRDLRVFTAGVHVLVGR